jgi:hypothetical protein
MSKVQLILRPAPSTWTWMMWSITRHLMKKLHLSKWVICQLHLQSPVSNLLLQPHQPLIYLLDLGMADGREGV